jgi:hypothetical protein
LAEIIPFLRAVAASRDWTNQEKAELLRLANLLARGDLPFETAHGVSDQGDPWFVVTSALTGDVLLHLARINGQFVAHTVVSDLYAQDANLRRLIDRMVKDAGMDDRRFAESAVFQSSPLAVLLLLAVDFYLATEPGALDGVDRPADADAAAALAADLSSLLPPEPSGKGGEGASDGAGDAVPGTEPAGGEEVRAAALVALSLIATAAEARVAVPPAGSTAAAAGTGSMSVGGTTPSGTLPGLILSGTAGADSLVGGAGNDLIRGGAGDDSLIGGAGNDTLVGGEGRDLLIGGEGDDLLIAGGGPGIAMDVASLATGRTGPGDTLDGGAGDDILVLAVGTVAIGGDGADSFVIGASLIGTPLRHAPDSGAVSGGTTIGGGGLPILALIRDFDAGAGDRLVLDGMPDARILSLRPVEGGIIDWGGGTLQGGLTGGSTITEVVVDQDGDGQGDFTIAIVGGSIVGGSIVGGSIVGGSIDGHGDDDPGPAGILPPSSLIITSTVPAPTGPLALLGSLSGLAGLEG